MARTTSGAEATSARRRNIQAVSREEKARQNGTTEYNGFLKGTLRMWLWGAAVGVVAIYEAIVWLPQLF